MSGTAVEGAVHPGRGRSVGAGVERWAVLVYAHADVHRAGWEGGGAGELLPEIATVSWYGGVRVGSFEVRRSMDLGG